MRDRRVLTGVVIGLLAAALALPNTAAAEDPVLPVLTLEEALALGPADAPTGDVGMIVHADFDPTDPYKIGDVAFTALTIDVTPDEGVMTLSAVPSGGDDGTEVEECTDPAFGTVGKRWSEADLPIEFSLNHRTIPEYMSKWLTTRSIREAHQVWGNSNTRCGDKDNIDFRFNYTGSTKRRIERDGVNNNDFGNLRGGAVGLTYLWYRGDKILEVDMRLSNQYMWTNRPGGKRFNVKNVAVHEIGHTLGLDDLSSPHGSLTMYGVVNRGEMRKVTLGKGDLRGAQLLSP